MQKDTYTNPTGLTRREVLTGISLSALGSLAGCAGDSGGGDGGTETTTKQADDGDGETPIPDDSDNGDGGTPTPGDAGDGPTFEGVVEVVNSYAFEITNHYQASEVSGRFHRGDQYLDIRGLGSEQVEYYRIDGDEYVVTSGICVADPDAGANPTSNVDFGMTGVDTFEGHIEGHASIRPAGTTTIEGEDVYRFEISDQDVDVRYFVSATSGFLRRYEQEGPAGTITIEFHSWGEAETISPPEDCSVAGDGTDEPTTQTPTDEGPMFAETVTLADSYAFEITRNYQDVELQGRHHGGDYHYDITIGGYQEVEVTWIGDDTYVVTSGLCLRNPDASNDPTSDLAFATTQADTYETHVQGHAEITAAGTTTIDGEEVYKYEIATGDVDVVYYVNTQTGFLRRYVQQDPGGEVVVEFHSWGEVDPISKPDMPCQ